MMSDLMEKMAETLERAAGLLEIHGWTQCVYKNEAGAMCIRGALYQAVGLNTNTQQVITSSTTVRDWNGRSDLAISAAYRLARKVGAGSEISWNDEDGRTADEVIDALKETAKDIRNEVKPS
jgi:hypothetical protein